MLNSSSASVAGEPPSALLTAALDYAANKFLVFPVRPIVGGACSCDSPECERSGKHPAVNWGTLATTDPTQIKKWWAAWPNAGIGIACGPSGIVVLDVDPSKGGDASFDALRSEIGSQHFETPTVRTGGGGRHYFYRLPRGSDIRNSTSELARGLDIRGIGGYAVLAPSLHVSGNRYEWVPGRGLDEIEMLPFPDTLAQRLKDAARKTSESRFDPQRKIANGSRNATLTSIAGGLRNQSLSAEAMFAALQVVNDERCEKPLPLHELATIARSVEKYPPKFGSFGTRGAGQNGYANGHTSRSNDVSEPPTDDAPASRFIDATSIDFDDEPERECFFPSLLWRGEFHMYYGAGGIGKTGFAAKVLADVSNLGHKVGFVISEDRSNEFIQRYLAVGGVFDNLKVYDQKKERLMFPSDGPTLRACIEAHDLACLLFDSVMDHVANDSGLNAAEKARFWAGALHDSAMETNCAIIGVGHTNAAGRLEGAEMIRNKARYVVRVADNNGVLTAKNEKAKYEKAGAEFLLTCALVPKVHPRTGVRQTIRQNGASIPASLWVCTAFAPHVPAALPEGTPFDLSKVGKTPAKYARAPLTCLVDWMHANPGPHGRAVLQHIPGVNKNRLTQLLATECATGPLFTMTKGTGAAAGYALTDPTARFS